MICSINISDVAEPTKRKSTLSSPSRIGFAPFQWRLPGSDRGGDNEVGMPKLIDLTGQRFGRWTVLGGFNNNGKVSTWDCKCDCGKELRVRAGNLKRGASVSCGCYKMEVLTKHGLWKDPIYIHWAGMIARTKDKSRRDWKDYGGRGISVCDEWKDIISFKRDMGGTFKPGLTLDRINVNGNYCKENCKWSDRRTQQNNKRDNDLIEYHGFTMTMANWCRHLEVPRSRLYVRVHTLNWPLHLAFFSPV